MELLDAGPGVDFGPILRKRAGRPFQLAPPDPFAALKPIGDFAGNVGQAVGGAIEKARSLPVVGGALDALGAVGDATVSTPVGLAALGADRVLGTGLTEAAQRQNAGRPWWELPKTAAQTVSGAFGEIASDETQDPRARLIAGLARGTEQVGGFIAPIPGGAAAARLVGRGANALPAALERAVGDVSPGAGVFGSRQSPRVTAGFRQSKGEGPAWDSARQQIAESRARQEANPTPPEELARRFPTSWADLEQMRAKGQPVPGEMPKPSIKEASDLFKQAAGMTEPSKFTLRAPSIKANVDELRQNALRQRIAGPTPTAAAAPDTALGQRMLPNESGIVAAAARGESWVTPELLRKHYANEALTNAAKSGDVTAAREALATLESLGASASNTASHLRKSGVDLPRGATFAHIREALMPKPIKDMPPLAPRAPLAPKPPTVETSPLGAALRARLAPEVGPTAPPVPPAAPAARTAEIIPIESIREIKAANARTLDELRARIAQSRSGNAPPPPPPPAPPAAPPPTPPPPVPATPPPASGLDKFLSVWNFPKAIKASLDVSAPFRQGIFLSAGHPGRFFGQFAPMFKALGSEKFAREFDASIRATPRSKRLYIAPIDNATLGAREEAFMSGLADKVPGVSASNRAYVTYLNGLRAGVYDDVVAGWKAGGKTVTDADLDGLADFINHATGRGDLGKLNDIAPALNGLFFSPRFVASRFQSIGDALGVVKSPSSLAAREAATDMVKFVGAGLTVLTLAKMAGAQVEGDPRSANFGKIKVGPHTVDIWGGSQQVARYTAQFITGQSKTASGKNAGKVRDQDRGETLERFVRSKLSPTAGEVNNVLGIVGGGGTTAKQRKENAGKGFGDQVIGRDFIGQPVTPGSLPERLLAPMGPGALAEAVSKDDDKVRATVVGLLNMLGFSTNTFDDASGAAAGAPTPGPTRRSGGNPFLAQTAAPSAAPSERDNPFLRVAPSTAPRRTQNPFLTSPGGPKPGSPALIPPPSGEPITPPGDVTSIVSRAAQQSGIDPRLALAVAEVESGFNVNAVGDNGDSHGLFQENRNGRGHGRAPDYDPARQTQRFAADVRRLIESGFRGTPGELAAAAQRPYDPEGYARKVNAAYSRR